MNTRRHYFISDNLDDIDLLEEQLESEGLSPAQTHVLSNDDVGVARHIHLHEVASLLRQDVIRSSQVGAVIGFLGALIIIAVAYMLRLPSGMSGWVPYAFLSVIVFGFCLWEGGLFGIQAPNRQYKQFEEALAQGKHVFFVDLNREQERILTASMEAHPKLEMHAMGSGSPSWIFASYDRLVGFLDRNLLSQSQI